jgi:hypothetical protein
MKQLVRRAARVHTSQWRVPRGLTCASRVRRVGMVHMIGGCRSSGVSCVVQTHTTRWLAKQAVKRAHMVKGSREQVQKVWKIAHNVVQGTTCISWEVQA